MKKPKYNLTRNQFAVLKSLCTSRRPPSVKDFQELNNTQFIWLFYAGCISISSSGYVVPTKFGLSLYESYINGELLTRKNNTLPISKSLQSYLKTKVKAAS